MVVSSRSDADARRRLTPRTRSRLDSGARWHWPLFLTLRKLGPGSARDQLLASGSREEAVSNLVAAVLDGTFEEPCAALLQSLVTDGMADVVRPLMERRGGEWIVVSARAGDTAALGRGSLWMRAQAAAALVSTPEGRSALLELESSDGEPLFARGDPVLPALLSVGDGRVYDAAIRRMEWAFDHAPLDVTGFQESARVFWAAGANPPEDGPLLRHQNPKATAGWEPPWSRPRTVDQCRAVLEYAVAWRARNCHAHVLKQQFEVMCRSALRSDGWAFCPAASAASTRIDRHDRVDSRMRRMDMVEMVWSLVEETERVLREPVPLPADFPRA